MTSQPEYGAPVAAPPTCYRHPGRETGVRCSRCGRPICPDCMIPASVGFQCPECVAEGRRSVRSARTIYGGRLHPGSMGTVTKILMGINLAVFVVTVASGANVLTGASGHSTIYLRFALIPGAVAHGQYYRLLTSMFLHFGILHIGFNMYALWIVGPQLESALGRSRYVVLYLLSGLGGALLSTAFGSPVEISAGASGAIFGLFGAYYVIARHRRMATGSIVALIAINLVISFSFGGEIDWRSHVGGLVTGLVLAVILAFAPAGARRTQVQVAGIVAVCVLMSGLGLLAVDHAHSKCQVLQSRGGVPVSCQAAPPPV